MTRCLRLGVLSLAALAGCAALAPPSAAADAATELANRYAPVIRLVEQDKPCGHGEAYEPTDVDVVLRSPDVALRGPWDSTNIVKIAPTAQDLARGLFGYNLDFPGRALSPGCTYDEWSHRITADVPTTTYARITTEGAFPGQLALQYWFFYVFNDFNDKHEGDWEMIQLNFAASTPRTHWRPTRQRSATANTRVRSARAGVTTSSSSSIAHIPWCIRHLDPTRTTTHRSSTWAEAPRRELAATTRSVRPPSSGRS
jgi:hypothetical protein